MASAQKVEPRVRDPAALVGEAVGALPADEARELAAPALAAVAEAAEVCEADEAEVEVATCSEVGREGELCERWIGGGELTPRISVEARVTQLDDFGMRGV